MRNTFQLTVFLAFWLLPGIVVAQQVDTSYFDGSRLTLLVGEDALSFAPYDHDMIRIGFHHGADTSYPHSLSVVMEPSGLATLEEDEETMTYISGRFTALIHKDPFYFDVISGIDTILRNGSALREGAGSRMELSTDPDLSWYGGGSRAIPMDRNGRTLLMVNRPHYGYGWESDVLNISIPVVVNNVGFGLYYETPVPGILSLGGEVPGKLIYQAETGPLSCFVFQAGEPRSVMEPFTALTGRQPLPPLWALGYIQSRFGYENENEARNVVETMLEEGFPLDAIVFDLQWQGGVPYMGDLSWDLSRFPDPVGMMDDFSDLGVKSVCITDPYFTQLSQHYPFLAVKDYFAFNGQGNPYVLNDFWAGPAGLIDITDSSVVEWFWQHYRYHTDQGVAGWWTDLGEPELVYEDMYFDEGSAAEIRQTYNLRWSSFLYEKFLEKYPQRRIFNLTRSGYAGMQRTGAIPWSGDVQKTYDGLRAQIPVMLGMGLSGSGYMSSDIGGFTGSKDEELYTRWQQMGAFTPVMRAHGTGVPTEPIYYPEPYRGIVKDYIKLRYALLPYNYTLLYENFQTGMPPARPLYFYDPTMTSSDEEYFWGKDLLVAPVLEPGAVSRSISFPEGRWIDFFRLYSYEGRMTVTVPVTLDHLPLFVKAGALIPMLRDISNTASYKGNSLLVRYFPDPEATTGNSRIFLDDGATRKYMQGEFSEISLEATYDPASTEILFERTGGGYDGEEMLKVLEFEIMRTTEEPSLVTFNGEEVPFVSARDDYDQSTLAAFHDQAGKKLMVKVPWNASSPGSLHLEGLDISTSFGIKEPESQQWMTIHPNPLTSFTSIDIVAGSPGKHMLRLYDLSGREIASRTIMIPASGNWKAKWSQLFPGELSPGSYILGSAGQNRQDQVKIIVR